MLKVNDTVVSSRFGTGRISEDYWCVDVGRVFVCIFPNETALGTIVYYDEAGRSKDDDHIKLV